MDGKIEVLEDQFLRRLSSCLWFIIPDYLQTAVDQVLSHVVKETKLDERIQTLCNDILVSDFDVKYSERLWFCIAGNCYTVYKSKGVYRIGIATELCGNPANDDSKMILSYLENINHL